MAKTKPKKPIHRLSRSGSSSYSVAISPSLIRSLGWKEGQRLLVKRMARGILLRDAITKKRK
ncbi:MAG: hypothetical protein HYW51_03175 [Candidatus Doudnabacteria bacterium]|nr:hypothetical protein [Candidatus Doudnabacteria bacterium]